MYVSPSELHTAVEVLKECRSDFVLGCGISSAIQYVVDKGQAWYATLDQEQQNEPEQQDTTSADAVRGQTTARHADAIWSRFEQQIGAPEGAINEANLSAPTSQETRPMSDTEDAETTRQAEAARLETERQAREAADQQERLDKAGREYAEAEARRIEALQAQAAERQPVEVPQHQPLEVEFERRGQTHEAEQAREDAIRQHGALELRFDPPGMSLDGKPALAEVERVEELRRNYEEFQRERQFEREEQQARERFEAYHDRRGTDPEQRELARQELEHRFEEHRQAEERRMILEEQRRAEEMRQLHAGREP